MHRITLPSAIPLHPDPLFSAPPEIRDQVWHWLQQRHPHLWNGEQVALYRAPHHWEWRPSWYVDYVIWHLLLTHVNADELPPDVVEWLSTCPRLSWFQSRWAGTPGVLIWLKDETDHWWISERSQQVHIGRGTWTTFTGGIDMEDISHPLPDQACAIRELQEETGITHASWKHHGGPPEIFKCRQLLR